MQQFSARHTSMNTQKRYRGRFAPSPSGPLHLGSLVAAMASYIDAKKNDGSWLVRMEDVDETRTVPGASDDILRTLEQLGFEWEGAVILQSARKDHYAEVIAQLLDEGRAYYCSCSRSEIARSARRGIEGWVYPGTCRTSRPTITRAKAIRLITHDTPISFVDGIKGVQSQSVESEIGDFIIRRADGFAAYQLAVVVDDFDQDITHVVRGEDLLTSTPRQILLQQILQLPSPAYAHVPLVLDREGRKLSKQDQAHPVSKNDPLPALQDAWRFLYPEQALPDAGSVEEFWSYAVWSQP